MSFNYGQIEQRVINKWLKTLDTMTNITCKQCGWVYFKHPKEKAQEEGWYEERHTKCKCGSKSFRPTKKGDVPDGCTINPIILEDTCTYELKKEG